jgi:hypothetical protein
MTRFWTCGGTEKVHMSDDWRWRICRRYLKLLNMLATLAALSQLHPAQAILPSLRCCIKRDSLCSWMKRICADVMLVFVRSSTRNVSHRDRRDDRRKFTGVHSQRIAANSNTHDLIGEMQHRNVSAFGSDPAKHISTRKFGPKYA